MRLDLAAPGSIPSAPKKISKEKIIDVAEVYQRRCFEESGKWLENVDQDHLVLASGKQVLQKTFDNYQSKSGLIIPVNLSSFKLAR